MLRNNKKPGDLNPKWCYRVLDVGISLDADWGFRESFDRDYGWFRVPPTSGSFSMSVSVRLGRKDPIVRINKEDFLLKGHPAPETYAHQIILRELFRDIRGFFLLHAAVAGKSGKALIVAGPPGAGKTTLVLRLLKKGYAFFSDDLCPMHLETRMVHPFPRSIWISEADPKPGKVRLRGGKAPIRPNELGVGI
ncbi:MAG: hypothetical protein SV775_19660, partial [Thermodesulfobacteriota bacterium]|nr:hypothetical protein [Thermodesulfobacteriota bacterium]